MSIHEWIEKGSVSDEIAKKRVLIELVRCKDCKYLIDHYGFMDDGYCRKMEEEYCVKFKPDKNWFCADGKSEKGR